MQKAVFLVFLSGCLSFGDTFDISRNEFDLYGSTLASNDHMVVTVQSRTNALFYVSFTDTSNVFCQIDTNYLFRSWKYILQIAIPDGLSLSSDTFFYLALANDGSNDYVVLVRVRVYASYCGHSTFFPDRWNYAPEFYLFMGVHRDGNTAFVQSGNLIRVVTYTPSSSHTSLSFTWWNNRIDNPYAVDISSDGLWGVIAGEQWIGGIYMPTLYLIDFHLGASNYTILEAWTVPISYAWQRRRLSSNIQADDYNVVNASAVAINARGEVLFGVQTLNTVYHLRVNFSSTTRLTLISARSNSGSVPGVGFGKSVAWLDDDTAVILANNISLHYRYWYSSRIEIYDLSHGNRLHDGLEPYSYFPNAEQPLPPIMVSQLILMVASHDGSISIMDATGTVYLIHPSPYDRYADTTTSQRHIGSIYGSSTVPCPEGSSRSQISARKTIFDRCKPCSEDFYFGIDPTGVRTCIPCRQSEAFCPIGAIAPIPLSYLEKRTQATRYPRSMDVSAFDDILLSSMFSSNFQNNCFIVAPMFWTYAALALASLVLLLMGYLQYTGKCPLLQKTMKSILSHFDIINDGEVSLTTADLCESSSFDLFSFGLVVSSLSRF